MERSPRSRVWYQGVVAGLVSFSVPIAGQSLPAIPSTQETDALPSPEELAPLRPFVSAGSAKSGPPFRWRGENIKDQPDSWSIEQGAIENEGLLLVADRISYAPRRGVLEAEGNIRLELQGLRLRCQRLCMDWENKIGEAWALELELPPNWVLKSSQVSFNTFRHWDFKEVDVSPCPQEKPGWNAKLSSLKLDLNEFATFYHARLYLGGVFPVFYLPWATYPAKAQRSSGFLPPQIGFGSASLGLSYYQVLGDTMDATFAPEYFSREGMLWGGEYRWAPDYTHQGFLQGQYIHQKTNDEHRYRYVLRELWQREDGWQFTAEVNQASDSLLEVDFGKSIGNLGNPSFDSALYLGKNFPWAAVSLSAAEQRTFFLPNDPFYRADFPNSLRRQSFPKLEARAYPIPFGNFYIDGSLMLSHHAYRIQAVGDTDSAKYSWSRGDFLTRMQGRLGQWGPFRSDLQVSARATYYTSGLHSAVFDPGAGTSGSPIAPEDPFRVDGDSIIRKLVSARLQFSGPQLGRSFENFHFFSYRGDLKHVLEPFFAFTTTGNASESSRVPRFDEVDIRPGVGGSIPGERSVEIGMKQHLMERPGIETAFNDFVRWKISTRFHFSPVILPDGRYKKGWGSLDNDIDAEPNDRIRLSFRQSSEIGEGGGTDSSLSAEYKPTRGGRFSLAAFSAGINQFLVRQQGLQISGMQQLWDERWRLEFNASYDRHMHTISNAQAAIAFVMPCTAFSLRYSHVAMLIPGSKENRVDLVLTLRGLGDLLRRRW